MLILMTLFVGMSSCSKDDDEPNPYKDAIIGTWKITEFSTNNSNYVNWMKERTTATFKSDGTYYGSGYFGNGSGTYTLKGSHITTYVEGEEYLSYDILSLVGGNATLKMSMTGSTEILYIKVVKQ